VLPELRICFVKTNEENAEKTERVVGYENISFPGEVLPREFTDY
jgi:hypothetical protein